MSIALVCVALASRLLPSLLYASLCILLPTLLLIQQVCANPSHTLYQKSCRALFSGRN